MRKGKKTGLTRVLHVQADYDELCAVAEEDDVENDPAYQMMLVSLPRPLSRMLLARMLLSPPLLHILRSLPVTLLHPCKHVYKYTY
jgi:hypothetical protein